MTAAGSSGPAGRKVPRLGEAELLIRYRLIAYRVAREFFIPGSDRDDVEQEAMLGLLCGIRTYDPGRGPLVPHLNAAARQWMRSAIKQANRVKHRPLQSAVREGFAGDGELVAIADLIVDPRVGGELEARESLRQILAALPSLSPAEREALAFALNGGSYTHDGLKDKRVDNALQRARQKLRAAA
jgi:RNA polymerase sigma factor (sigma-70 family)